MTSLVGDASKPIVASVETAPAANAVSRATARRATERQ